MHQLSPMDAAFLYMESESVQAHGTFVWLYDASECAAGSVTRKALLTHMRSRLQVSHIFTQKIHRLPLDFDYPYWVDDDAFELLYHVREKTGPDAGDWEGFCNLVSEVHSRPLSAEHPLWEMTLINSVNDMPGLPSQCFAILGKFHHVAIDGASGMEIIARIHDEEPFPPGKSGPESTESDTRVSQKPELSKSLYRAAIRNLAALDKVKQMVSSKHSDEEETGGTIPAEVEELLDPNPSEGIPATVFNQKVAAQRAYDSRSFSLQEIKNMRKLARGATVNDVLLAICAGGLRSYMENQDALPDKPMKAGCPINIRTAEEAESGGNKISAMIVNIHTDIEDPLERLKAITASSQVSKAGAERRGSRQILDLTSLIPAQTQAVLGHMAGKITGLLNRPMLFNCPISNLPGPQQDLHILGGRLHTIGASMPVMPGFGLFIGLCTCAGNLSISLTSSTNITPRIQDLGDCMQESFKQLQKAGKRKSA
jgi:WS/DGAT/MGAT family acyltransferase